jgi:LacI family gluconate utilization system Gnt-I transcriptional repressor
VPDPAARALASRRSTHVAVLIPMLTNMLFVEMLEALQQVLRGAGYQTLIGVTHYDPEEEEQLLREQLAHRPAGLIITGLDRNEATRALIAECGLPCVHLMEVSPTPDVHSVGLSQFDAAMTMTRHLLGRGYRRIAFAAAQLDPRTLQRLEGWRREMSSAGCHDMALECLDPAPSSLVLGGAMLEKILEQDPSVDAIFFCNDDLAQGALLAAQRHGIAVPDRVAVAGFNDLVGSDLMVPPLTTVRTPRREIGDAGARMLLQLLGSERPAQPSLDLGFTLMVRGST